MRGEWGTKEGRVMQNESKYVIDLRDNVINEYMLIRTKSMNKQTHIQGTEQFSLIF